MTSNKEHIRIVTSVERRRHWSPQDKKIIVEETYQPGNTISLVARKYAITPAQLFKWRRLMENGAYQGVLVRKKNECQKVCFESWNDKSKS